MKPYTKVEHGMKYDFKEIWNVMQLRFLKMLWKLMNLKIVVNLPLVLTDLSNTISQVLQVGVTHPNLP